MTNDTNGVEAKAAEFRSLIWSYGELRQKGLDAAYSLLDDIDTAIRAALAKQPAEVAGAVAYIAPEALKELRERGTVQSVRFEGYWHDDIPLYASPPRPDPAANAHAGMRLLDLIGRYWDIAYSEGENGSKHDDPDGTANKTYAEILSLVQSLAAPIPASDGQQAPETAAYICFSCSHVWTPVTDFASCPNCGTPNGPINAVRVAPECAGGGEAPGRAVELAVEGLRDWAVSCWHAEVANRPMVNVHRRTLDTTWRQVIRQLGGDPAALLGPSHDDLRAAITTKEWEAMSGIVWTDEGYVAAPGPKVREPLTEETITAEMSERFWRGLKNENFKAGVRYAERMHGIAAPSAQSQAPADEIAAEAKAIADACERADPELPAFLASRVGQEAVAAEPPKTYRPTEAAVRDACDILTLIRDSYEHWKGWSGIPANCERAINALRYSGLSAPTAAAPGEVEPAMPPLPSHPDPHTYCWSMAEMKAITDFGRACIAAARAAGRAG